MPRYIRSIFGYVGAPVEKMYFNGGDFSSINGRQFVDERDNPATADNVTVTPKGVPGLTKDEVDTIKWDGDRTEYSGSKESKS